MEINNLTFTGVNNASQALKAQEAIANYKTEATEKEVIANDKSTLEDSYTKSNSGVTSETGIYSKENIKKTVEQLEEQRLQSLNNMVTEMLGKQANSEGLSYLNLSDFTVTDDKIAEAKNSISDGGYWSVDAVATRIMDMASLLANGDSSKISVLKEAVIKGFGGAVDALGRESLDDMPEITRNTYDEVLKRFDSWEKETSETTQAE